MVLGLLLDAGQAHAVTCNQSPVGNTVLLGCTKQQAACVVLNRTVEGDCTLDYEGRPVTFRGTFDFGRDTVDVVAGAVTVEGTMYGRSTNGTRRGGRLTMTATTGNVVTSNKIDVSGDSAGWIVLKALQGSITVGDALTATGRDDESPNGASGGLVRLEAAGAIALNGEVQAGGGADASGGDVDLRAGGTLTVTQRIVATGGGRDGGDVTMLAGDDILVTRSIDVSSTTGGGSGGGIGMQAGIDTLGGTRAGGTLEMRGDLTSQGSSEGGGEDAAGGDGGEIALAASGTVIVSGRIDAVGASPDGAGGTIDIVSTDADPLRLTVLDGDLSMTGVVTLRGAVSAQGGSVTLYAGRDLTLAGAGFDLSGGEEGGELTALAGRNIGITATLNANARVREGDGGTIEVFAGLEALGTLMLGARLDANGATDGRGGSLTLAACRLTTGTSVTCSATAGRSPGRGSIDLAATHTMTLGNGSRYLANPGGTITLVRPPSVVPAIGSNVVFNPGRADLVTTTSVLFPSCPVCGDGIRQPGETCDPGAGADGACCNGTCTALLCATATPTATPTVTRTPTPTASDTATPIATPTRTPTPTTAATAAGPSPTIAGGPTITPGATPIPSLTASGAPTATTTSSGPTPTAAATSSEPTATPTPEETPGASPGGATGTPETVTPRAGQATPTPVPTVTAVLPLLDGRAVTACERALGRAATDLALADLTAWQRCALEAFACVQRAPTRGELDRCAERAARRCERQQRRTELVRSRFAARFAARCAPLPLAALLAPDALAFGTVSDACENEIGLVLTSPEAVAACVELSGRCLAEGALAAGAPRSGDLLRLVADVEAAGVCAPPPTDVLDGLAPDAAAAVTRCQRALVVGGRRLLARTLHVLRTCVDATFGCRVEGKSEATCTRDAARCGERLAELPAMRTRALARLALPCGALDDAAVSAAEGLGLGTTGAVCLAPADTRAGLRCVLEHYGCTAVAIARRSLPMLDLELGGREPDPLLLACPD